MGQSLRTVTASQWLGGEKRVQGGPSTGCSTKKSHSRQCGTCLPLLNSLKYLVDPTSIHCFRTWCNGRNQGSHPTLAHWTHVHMEPGQIGVCWVKRTKKEELTE